MMSALVITRSRAPRIARGSRTLPHAVANDLAAAEGDLVAIGREILLDFDDQFGIGQAHPVAGGRPVQIRVGFPGNREAHLFGSFLLPWPRWPSTSRSPANSTKRTSFSSPGSNRTEVPAGMFRRMPRAACAVEVQRVVDFEKVIVAADLDGPVAGVPHHELRGLPPDVGLDRRRFQECIRLVSWTYWMGSCTVTSFVPSGKVASTWTS